METKNTQKNEKRRVGFIKYLHFSLLYTLNQSRMNITSERNSLVAESSGSFRLHRV